MKTPFLITGCGRSGTKYTSLVLQQCGLDVGHEKRGADGTVSSVWLINDPQGYPKWHAQDRPEVFKPILVQVRHPLDAISSLTTGSPISWEWNRRHIPLTLPKGDANSKLLCAAQYWYYWNIKALNKSVYRYSIERLREEWGAICRHLNIETPYEVATAGIPTNTNTRQHPAYSWEQLLRVTGNTLYRNIQDLSRMLGYV